MNIFFDIPPEENGNHLAKNPEYLKILAEIENHCFEKEQSCGPNLSYWEQQKIANSVKKFTKYNLATRFAQVIKHCAIMRKRHRKLSKEGMLTNFNLSHRQLKVDGR